MSFSALSRWQYSLVPADMRGTALIEVAICNQRNPEGVGNWKLFANSPSIIWDKEELGDGSLCSLQLIISMRCSVVQTANCTTVYKGPSVEKLIAGIAASNSYRKDVWKQMQYLRSMLLFL